MLEVLDDERPSPFMHYPPQCAEAFQVMVQHFAAGREMPSWLEEAVDEARQYAQEWQKEEARRKAAMARLPRNPFHKDRPCHCGGTVWRMYYPQCEVRRTGVIYVEECDKCPYFHEEIR